MSLNKILIEQQPEQEQIKIQPKTVDKVFVRSQPWYLPGRVPVKNTSKRKADLLSPSQGKTTKRILHDRGINVSNKPNNEKKLVATIKPKDVKVTPVLQPKIPVYVDRKATPGAPKKKNIVPSVEKQTKVLVESAEKISETKYDCVQVTSCGKFRQSLENNQDKVDEALYITVLEELLKELDESSSDKKRESVSSKVPPPGVEDFDKEYILDLVQVPEYAMDIFKYMLRKEHCFTVQDYMPKQVLITKCMRAVLVDWMVDIQENLNLNHEALYLAVKITDIYLSKVVVGKEIFQLLGVTALFLSAKYFTGMTPLIGDFVHITVNAFTKEDMRKMEMNLFKVIDFRMEIPLSYEFLRRFIRCSKVTMPTLTLARYILELSLMEYHMIFYSESKIACAALYVALRMKKVSGWTNILEYYSGYHLSDFMPIVLDLNSMLHQPPNEQLQVIRNKYSDKTFFEVTKTPLLSDEELKCETLTDNKGNEKNV